MEFLDSLLRQPKGVQPRRSTSVTRPAPTITRNTGPLVTKSDRTGTIQTKRNTGAIPTSSTSGIAPKRNTGAITTSSTSGIAPKRTTGAISTSSTSGIAPKRTTGAIPTSSTSGIAPKRTTGKIARYSVEDEDLYGVFSDRSSVIYTAGTNLFWVILIAIIVWLIVSMAQASPNQSIVSSYSQDTGLRAVAQIIGIELPASIAPEPEAKPVIIPPGESSILGAPTVTAAQIDGILAANNSPAAGTGAIWIEAGLQYGIDPAYGLAFFMHESSYGTNPAWAGNKPDGTTTHNVGNIICAGYRTCFGRFRDYPDWRTGIYDWYRLISVEYVQWRGLATVEGILPVYAPSFENDVPRYVNVIKYTVAEWRQANIQPTP
ncbi:MAG: glucosaminidase domain-containing protein [Chloroflexota bacterium]